jgi:hypothetical protein
MIKAIKITRVLKSLSSMKGIFKAVTTQFNNCSLKPHTFVVDTGLKLPRQKTHQKSKINLLINQLADQYLDNCALNRLEHVLWSHG